MVNKEQEQHKDVYGFNQRGDCISSGRLEWNQFYNSYTVVDTTQNMGIRYKQNNK